MIDLRKHLKYKELGWEEIGEKFTRYALWRTRWFNVYLHELMAPKWDPKCHDHPWWFITVLLCGGYLEHSDGRKRRRLPGMILFRRASFSHRIITPYGKSWSLVITGKKSAKWGHHACE